MNKENVPHFKYLFNKCSQKYVAFKLVVPANIYNQYIIQHITFLIIMYINKMDRLYIHSIDLLQPSPARTYSNILLSWHLKHVL